ncbi:DUF7684 family protein [Massilia niastensis]|uniref:DUF7684 family protein n=1 Tax=Massilia niastensis TaxID=544911 RepID=UPI0003760B53|nr:hypothetical protein [Massilia niastensis]
MHKPHLTYLQILPEGELPDIARHAPFAAILVVDDDADEMWRWDAARWLVASGCRFLLAWGKKCESWAESVDDAALEAFDYDDIPEDKRVLTTWDEDEDLEEVFWFARHRARHPALALETTLILHIATRDRKDELEALYARA